MMEEGELPNDAESSHAINAGDGNDDHCSASASANSNCGDDDIDGNIGQLKRTLAKKRKYSCDSTGDSKRAARKRDRGLDFAWPPRFESRGSEYIFDTRSEMFYEAGSDFFYDPKSKLYYGNKQRAYFRYETKDDKSDDDEGCDEGYGDAEPLLVEVEKVSKDYMSTCLEVTPHSTAEQLAGGAASNDGRKRIAINLKTKKLARTNNSISNNGAGSGKNNPQQQQQQQQQQPADRSFATKSRQAQMANIQKWNTQGKSKRREAKLRKIVRTVKGDPVCLLCRRKFKSDWKLERHEDLSQMHKSNLAKHNSKGDKYVDRAQKRRNLHFGMDSSFVPAVTATAQAAPVASHQQRRPQHELSIVEQEETAWRASQPQHEDQDGVSSSSSANLGMKMLEKLGWKKEASTDPSHDKLRKDWDRIESMSRKR